ncbi:bifunctional 3-deoxy-7-phosphoheptulonate synthase/chorismate mutase [Longirhabdus pacifica]|uniref:bifunctional 3-deoxy-7-phosphoheptulonate synthase/chorismate mutase n=1 Tax=Longirhabdus pacifica TaxID=2305227 RepID=UPI0010091861|nr:bifunctional 3-deoxy-7-phosphoheptulonate synthase/chorismate mutase [Longirhabdus pacifica]
MKNKHTESLINKLKEIDLEIMKLINARGAVLQEISKTEQHADLHAFDPILEKEMLDTLSQSNDGPYETSTIQHLYKQIFNASLEEKKDSHSKQLLVSRQSQPNNTVVNVKGFAIGNGEPVIIAGPCAVESYMQVEKIAKNHQQIGLQFLRGGAFKPRTSPYDFQGLGIEGLEILKRIGSAYNLSVVSEIVAPQHIELATEYVDVIQIGARNMHNFELLKAAGSVNHPILLKRGLSATIEEFIYAAEYILSGGNNNVILCERGIRTYEKATRNTLDISAVPILKQQTHLPVIVDVTHSTGVKELLLPTAKAALAAGSDGVMVEVHPHPAVALSDAKQQLDIPAFNDLLNQLQTSGYFKTKVNK